MPVLDESHLGDFGAPILCTSGLCGMFLLMFKGALSDLFISYLSAIY